MTVSEQIIQVIDVLCEKFGIIVDWTSENVIPYVETLFRKLVIYEISTSVAWMVFMTLMSIGSIVVTKRFYPIFKNGLELEKERHSYDCGWEIGTTFAIIGLVVINLTTICVLATQIMDIIKCVTFPEMYIFEYISTLIDAA